MNLLLAVVVNSFSDNELQKLKGNFTLSLRLHFLSTLAACTSTKSLYYRFVASSTGSLSHGIQTSEQQVEYKPRFNKALRRSHAIFFTQQNDRERLFVVRFHPVFSSMLYCE